MGYTSLTGSDWSGTGYKELHPPEWSPLQLGASLMFWVRSDMGITLNGATVSAWADQSGLGRNATQGTAAKQPTYVATDPAFNGWPSLDFDGSNDIMDTASFTAIAQPFTVFVVAKADDTGANRTLLDSTSGSRISVYQPANLVPWAGAGIATSKNVGTSAARIIEIVFNGASTTTQLDGGSASTTNNGTNGWGQIRISSNNAEAGTTHWDGKYAEIGVAAGAVSSDVRSLWRRYLSNRYNITVT